MAGAAHRDRYARLWTLQPSQVAATARPRLSSPLLLPLPHRYHRYQLLLLLLLLLLRLLLCLLLHQPLPCRCWRW